MSATAYYNEIDPFAAQWLRNLIAGGHIAPGEVDERSVEDVSPDDLRGFTQCHFFAGIGVWSHSLRLARWPDDKPVWTGSCPCQPFSAAGKGNGFADERHLWPAFFHLISELRPQHVFGEQVASSSANAWFDLVQADLEGMDYAFGLVPFSAAGIGAPHIRERAYWVAHASSERIRAKESAEVNGEKGEIPSQIWKQRIRPDPWTGSTLAFCRLGNANITRLERHIRDDSAAGRERAAGSVTAAGVHGGLANPTSEQYHQCNNSADEWGWSKDTEQNRLGGEPVRALEVNGFWRDADWLFCRDEKWRPVEPGTFPLVARFAKSLGHGKSSLRAMAGRNRTGRLKGYGNAINAQAAAEFIRAYMGVL